MSKMSTFMKIVIAGAGLFGVYKLYKYVDEKEKQKAAELKAHKDAVLEEVNAELHQAEEWNRELKDITLNNENLKPSDRAYSYDLIKEKYAAIVNAKSIQDVDEARRDFEELHSILSEVKDPDTIETILKIDADKKAQAEKLRAEKAAMDMELQKYRQIGDVIERIGSKVVCSLVQ